MVWAPSWLSGSLGSGSAGSRSLLKKNSSFFDVKKLLCGRDFDDFVEELTVNAASRPDFTEAGFAVGDEFDFDAQANRVAGAVGFDLGEG